MYMIICIAALLFHVICTNLVCDNCSDIIIEGMVNPVEFKLCIGNDITITLNTPKIFDIYNGGSLKRDKAILSCTSKCCTVGDVSTHSVAYHCTNMDETDSGIYYGHILISCSDNHNVEWCTPNVTITVQNCSLGELQLCSFISYYAY